MKCDCEHKILHSKYSSQLSSLLLSEWIDLHPEIQCSNGKKLMMRRGNRMGGVEEGWRSLSATMAFCTLNSNSSLHFFHLGSRENLLCFLVSVCLLRIWNTEAPGHQFRWVFSSLIIRESRLTQVGLISIFLRTYGLWIDMFSESSPFLPPRTLYG